MGLVVPKTIDTGTDTSTVEALFVNLLLMSLFAVQHSVMARPGFKAWWTQYVPKPMERSTYVLAASSCLLLLFWQWRPIPTVVWNVDDPNLAVAVAMFSLVSWALVFTSTFIINHFELFGLSQVAHHLVDKEVPAPRFGAPLFYRASSALSRLRYRVLGSAGHDHWPSAVRRGDHGLHPGRHSTRGARPDCNVRRPVPRIQEARLDAYSLAQVVSRVFEKEKNHESYR